MTQASEIQSTQASSVGRQRTAGPPPRPAVAGTQTGLTRALGWFSIGLGLTELLAPRALARAIGVKSSPERLQLLGLRELTSGLGILLHGHPAWVDSRVAGDVMDLAALAAATRERGAQPGRIALASTAVLGVTALDVLASRRSRSIAPIPIFETIAIKCPPEALYRFFRDVQNLPQVVQSLGSVEALDGRRSRWVVKPGAGLKLEWELEIIAEEFGRRLQWRTLEGADLPHHGSLQLESLPGDRGTLVRLEIEPMFGGRNATLKLATLLRALPALKLRNELRRIKQWLEVGEVATTDGQPSGRRSAISRLLP
jgi:uncharacterized membrane protein